MEQISNQSSQQSGATPIKANNKTIWIVLGILAFIGVCGCIALALIFGSGLIAAVRTAYNSNSSEYDSSFNPTVTPLAAACATQALISSGSALSTKRLTTAAQKYHARRAGIASSAGRLCRP
jgi:flagellar basal body-associated protein FliL